MNSILHILSGTWFILSTNFPMWLDGTKKEPSFTYTIATHQGKQYLIDEVAYFKKGKLKKINGYDYPSTTDTNAFTWRGKGLLRIAKSKWEVKLLDEKNEWAVIWFSKTLFTPEGVDIICKKKTPDAGTLAEIKTKMLNDSVLKKHVSSLVDLK